MKIDGSKKDLDLYTNAYNRTYTGPYMTASAACGEEDLAEKERQREQQLRAIQLTEPRFRDLALASVQINSFNVLNELDNLYIHWFKVITSIAYMNNTSGLFRGLYCKLFICIENMNSDIHFK